MSDTTYILLADDHAVLRSGLRLLIDKQPDMTVVGEAGTGSEAITLAEKLNPDVILLDLNMPDLNGLDALPPLREQLPDARILILTMHDDVNYLQQALQAGANGYVLKKAVDSELINAIRAANRGETPVHAAMTQKLLQSTQASPPDQPADQNPWQELSEREHEVLRLVALGHTNAEIAETLYLSVKTVETYRSRGMDKLDLKTRAQLVKSALVHDILQD